MSLVELQRLQSRAGHISFIYFFNFPPFFSWKKEPPSNVGGSETVMFQNKNLKMMHNELEGGGGGGVRGWWRGRRRIFL